MKVVFQESKNIENIKKAIEELEKEKNVLGVMALICDGNKIKEEDFSDFLKKLETPITGGIFPKILYEGKSYEEGFLLIGLDRTLRTYSFQGLSNDEADFEGFLEDLGNLKEDEKTFLVFMDGFSRRITDFKDSLYEYFGWSVNYIGGGAGSLTFQQKPVIITNEGLLEDGVSIGILSQSISIGVAHGWKPISKAFKVTKAKGNQIFEIDYKPAFQVYKNTIEEHSHHSFEKEDFFSIAKAYPFGITKLANEMIVRDPITRGDDDSINLVGEVPEGSYVYILNGDRDSLLAGAKEAKDQACSRYYKEKTEREAPKNTLFIDCISRVLFLGEEFDREIRIVTPEGSAVFGALTIGEIANKGEDYLEFYNKTSVVGIFEEGK